MSKIRILAQDPGSPNFAYSILEARLVGRKFQYRIIKCGIVKNVIGDLTKNVQQSASNYRKELEAMLRKHGPFDYLVAERYMSRGRFGATIEYVNVMLGLNLMIMARKSPKTIINYFPAVTWKNRIRKGKKNQSPKFDLNQTYKLIATTPHEFDATLIGLYMAALHFKLEPFSMFSKQKQLYTLLDCVEKASVEPLRNTKIKRK